MKQINFLKFIGTAIALGSVLVASGASANENVVGRSQITDLATISTNVALSTLDRQLKKEQLPKEVKSTLNLADGPEQSGEGFHPFTTQGAGDEAKGESVAAYPWSATGKLFMIYKNGMGQCTASVIGKSLLVTAAHCVHKFGTGEAGFPQGVVFEPARNGNERPYGTWLAKEWWIPRAYFDGTDICLPKAKGVVCENDLAVIVMIPLDGKSIAEVTGSYNIPPEPNAKGEEYGYVSFMERQAIQLTQLGYPAESYSGLKMIRTDSLGYQTESPANLSIGSAQTGGSSGGPWIQNFGSKTDFSGTQGEAAQINTVSAVTSWGYTADRVKVQGASRFAKNSIYTVKSNIRSLFDEACKANPTAC
jgi:V8-like Glu-specific endopeptidase